MPSFAPTSDGFTSIQRKLATSLHECVSSHYHYTAAMTSSSSNNEMATVLLRSIVTTLIGEKRRNEACIIGGAIRMEGGLEGRGGNSFASTLPVQSSTLYNPAFPTAAAAVANAIPPIILSIPPPIPVNTPSIIGASIASGEATAQAVEEIPQNSVRHSTASDTVIVQSEPAAHHEAHSSSLNQPCSSSKSRHVLLLEGMSAVAEQTAGRRMKRVYYCQRCINHGRVEPRRNHRAQCLFQECQCERCILVNKRRELNAQLHDLAGDDVGLEPPTQHHHQKSQSESEAAVGSNSPTASPKFPDVGLKTREELASGDGVCCPPSLSPYATLPAKPPRQRLSTIDKTKDRQPTCQKCSQHGLRSALKGHKKECQFKDCSCQKCMVISERQKLMADQIKIRRMQRKDELLMCARAKITANLRALENQGRNNVADVAWPGGRWSLRSNSTGMAAPSEQGQQSSISPPPDALIAPLDLTQATNAGGSGTRLEPNHEQGSAGAAQLELDWNLFGMLSPNGLAGRQEQQQPNGEHPPQLPCEAIGQALSLNQQALSLIASDTLAHSLFNAPHSSGNNGGSGSTPAGQPSPTDIALLKLLLLNSWCANNTTNNNNH